MNLTPYIVIWACLAAVVLVLAATRYFAGRHEDDTIHLGPGEEKLIAKQQAALGFVNRIETWGQTLTVVTVVGGLLIAADIAPWNIALFFALPVCMLYGFVALSALRYEGGHWPIYPGRLRGSLIAAGPKLAFRS